MANLHRSVIAKQTNTKLFIAAFIGLVETEAKIASLDHPFTMKPTWPSMKEVNENISPSS